MEGEIHWCNFFKATQPKSKALNHRSAGSSETGRAWGIPAVKIFTWSNCLHNASLQVIVVTKAVQKKKDN